VTKPDEPSGFQQALDRGLQLHQSGALREAEQVYRGLLDQGPHAFTPLHMLGVLRAQLGHAEEGADLIGQALRLAPGAATAWFNRANILAEIGRSNEALKNYDKAVEFSGDVRIRHHRARLLLEMGRAADALADLEQVVAAQPGNSAVLKDRGAALASLGREQEARRCYESALTGCPDDIETLNNLANILRASGQFQDALRLYDHAVAVSPAIAEIWNNRAAALSELRRYSEAVKSADRALALRADLAEAWNNRGDALRELGRLDEALAAFDGALAHKAAYPAAWNNRAKLLCEMGRVSEGFESFRRSSRLVYGDEGIHEPKTAFDAAQAQYRSRTGVAEGNRLPAPSVQTALWANSATTEWNVSRPQVTVIDQFLTQKALEALRQFCWTAPIWRREYDAGYVGAFPESGFACPLLAQIAEELQTALPSVFGDHALRYLWAFNYDSRGSGTHVHADEASVNVNFWITPDEANRDPGHGGLVVWDVAAPADWHFTQFNADASLVEGYLARQGGKARRIPYRSNRAVIFDASLFHKTDHFTFGPEYCDRRLNITFLYGRRPTGRSDNGAG
jgi:tetratricopeptide (TPR) repeat protein